MPPIPFLAAGVATTAAGIASVTVDTSLLVPVLAVVVPAFVTIAGAWINWRQRRQETSLASVRDLVDDLREDATESRIGRKAMADELHDALDQLTATREELAETRLEVVDLRIGIARLIDQLETEGLEATLAASVAGGKGMRSYPPS